MNFRLAMFWNLPRLGTRRQGQPMAIGTNRSPGMSLSQTPIGGKADMAKLGRKRRFCPRGASHEIDEIERVGRRRVAAPGNMLVRTHQHEPVAIEL